MPKPLEEVLDLLDELRAWRDEAEDDPEGAGRRLKQQIINRGNDLSSSTGIFYPSLPAGVTDREGIDLHNEEARQIKAEAKEISLWAIKNLPTGPE